MLKIRLNKENNIIDNLSDYEYSIIDINSNDDINEKMCYWLHNKNGHLNIDYNHLENHIFFGSATSKLENFKTKVEKI